MYFDIILCREILHIHPWLHRHGSVERGQLWDEIAAVLNSLKEPVFKVTCKSARDQYGLLVKKYKTKGNEEKRKRERKKEKVRKRIPAVAKGAENKGARA